MPASDITWVKYDLTPQPKVKQTAADRWKKRPCVLKYRAFSDEVRRLGVTIADGCHFRFEVAMPPSWPQKKRIRMLGQPHRQTPDLDNALGSLLDAVFPKREGKSDAHIASCGSLSKVWAETPAIWIGTPQSFGP